MVKRSLLCLVSMVIGITGALLVSQGCALSPHLTAVTDEPRIFVYYFHRTIRCEGCIKLERMSQASVEQGFGVELKKGTIRFQIINYEEPVYAHYEKEFQLQTQSLIVVETIGGRQTRWKELKKVWEYLWGDPGVFNKYVEEEIRAYLQVK